MDKSALRLEIMLKLLAAAEANLPEGEWLSPQDEGELLSIDKRLCQALGLDHEDEPNFFDEAPLLLPS
jgi:hypothetical protein